MEFTAEDINEEVEFTVFEVRRPRAPSRGGGAVEARAEVFIQNSRLRSCDRGNAPSGSSG